MMDLSQLFYQPSYNLSQKRTQLSQVPPPRSQFIDIPEAPVASEAALLPPVFQEAFDFQPSQLFKPKDSQENRNQRNLHSDEISASKKSKGFKVPITKVDKLPSFVTPIKRHEASHDRGHDGDIGSDVDLFESSEIDSASEVQIKDKLFTPAPLVLLNPLPSRNGIKLRPVEELPVKYRTIFKAFPYFNIVQSKVFDDVYYTDKPLVVCAPTGAGKTVIFELAIVRLLMKMQSAAVRGFKVVYMAPIKALCSERLQDWTEKFEVFGLKCRELTGDTEIDDYYELQEVNIILTTPEKWDSMTRRWRDNKCIVQSVCLFLIDEIHVLNDSVRGATIEAVISRMKTVSLGHSNTESQLPKLRFIAVSATIPNIEDIAEWMGENQQAATFYKMDDSFRPVRLRKVVLGFPFDEQKGSGFHFDMSLSYKLGGIINTYSDGKPALVFCSTRKGTQQAADILAKDSRSTYIKDVKNRQVLLKYSNLVKDLKLRDTLVKGIGIHHAGMDMQDRKYIEELFASSQLQVLVATSTLAMGVNLPAHLVILKSTQHYNMGMLEEYSNTQVLQMIGRAGRPQFDTTATAVIMTKTQNKLKYESLLNGTQLIESSLHKHLIEHLNAEIVLQTISDMAIAMEWIRHTYLYIRVMKNPKHYGMPIGLTREQTETKLQELCMRNLNQLAGIQMIKMNGETFDIQSTEAGRLMARYCIAFETMKKFCGVTGEESISDLLGIVAGSEEFMEVQLRVNEKKTLNTLNRDKNRLTIRFQLPGKIKTKQMKVNCLMQAQLGCLLVQDFALQQDTTRIFRAAQRLSRCLMEVLWIRDDYQAFLSAAQLCKAIKARLWENSKHVAKQLERIGPALSTALVNAGITSFQKIEETNPRDLELIVNRHPPFGNQVRDSVTYLPKYELTMEQVSRYNVDTAEILIHLSIANQESLETKKTASPMHTCILLVANTDNKIVFRRKLMDSFLLKEAGFTKKLEIQRAATGSDLYIHLISQDWVGLDVETTYSPYYLGATRISNVPSKGDKGNQQLNSGGIPLGGQTPGGLRLCNHRCYNKSQCGHKCCNSMTKAKSQTTPTPRTPAVTKLKTGSICSYISGLKNKLTMLPNTPSAKRIKMSNNSNSFNLNHFAYTPKRPMVSSEDGYSSHETIEQFSSDGSPESCPSVHTIPAFRDNPTPQYNNVRSCMSPEAIERGQAKSREQDELLEKAARPEYSGWTQLDLYQKRREEYMKEADNFQQEDDYDLPDLDIQDSPQESTTVRSQKADDYGSFGITSSLFPCRIPSPHRLAYRTMTYPDGTLSYSPSEDFDDNSDFQTSEDTSDTQQPNLSFSRDKSRTPAPSRAFDTGVRKRAYPYHSEDKDVQICEEEESHQHKNNPYTKHRFGQVVAWSNSQKQSHSCPVTPKQQGSRVLTGQRTSPGDQLSGEDPWSGSDNDLLMLEESSGVFRPSDQADITDSVAQNGCQPEGANHNYGKEEMSCYKQGGDIRNSTYGQGNVLNNSSRSQYDSSCNSSNTGNIKMSRYTQGHSGNNTYFGHTRNNNIYGKENIETSCNRQGNIGRNNIYTQGNVRNNSSSCKDNFVALTCKKQNIGNNPYRQGNMMQSNSYGSGNAQTSNNRPENTQSNTYRQGNPQSYKATYEIQSKSANRGTVHSNSSSVIQNHGSNIGKNILNNSTICENIRTATQNYLCKSSVQGVQNSSKPTVDKFQSKSTQQAKTADSLPASDCSKLLTSNNSSLTKQPKPAPPSYFTTDQSLSDSPQETFSSIFDGIF